MSTQQLDRATAATLDAERAVLGSIIVHGQEAFDLAADVLDHDVWFRHAHRLIWLALGKLVDARTPIDLVTLATSLNAADLEDVGGAAYVASLVDGGITSTNVTAYARKVRDAATRRGIAKIARELLADAEEGDAANAEIVEAVESKLFDLHAPSSKADVLTPAMRVGGLMTALDEVIARKGAIELPTGIGSLDALTRGFRPGQLWVIGARPGAGKSALAMTLAVNVSQAGPVGFISLEMSAEELGMRELALRGNIPYWRLAAGLIRPEDPRLATAFDALTEGGIQVIDVPGATSASIRRAARRLVAKHGRLALLIVDYLQLVQLDTDQRYGNRSVEVGLISSALKRLARELEIPILALSQLNRGPENRTDKRPTLADFRESGAIEQDADVALLLHREGYYDKSADQTRAEINLAKQRNGPTGLLDLGWQAEEMRFTDFLGHVA